MLSAIDVAIFVSFLLYSVWSGLRSRAISSQNLEEYFLAGRSLPGWKAGLSMAATQFAADTPLLGAGRASLRRTACDLAARAESHLLRGDLQLHSDGHGAVCCHANC